MSNLNLASLTLEQGISIAGANIGDKLGDMGSFTYYALGARSHPAGDVNGDGYPDIVIGAPSASPNAQTFAGISYVIFGNNSLTNIDLSHLLPNQGFKIYGTNAHDYIGYAVGGIGDVNNDGYDDIFISSKSNPKYDYFSRYNIIFGSNITNDIDLSNFSPSQGFTISGRPFSLDDLSSIDVNQDGYMDIIIDKVRGGKVYVIFGNDSINNINLNSFSSSEGFFIEAGFFMFQENSVLSIEDINNDSYVDFLIHNSDYGTFLVFGNHSASNIIFSDNNMNYLLTGLSLPHGFSILGNHYEYVHILKDLNNDGNLDVIIGGYKDNPNSKTNAGVVYVMYGPITLSTIESYSLSVGNLPLPGYTISGAMSYDYLGRSLSISDINQDGYDDLIIGAPGASPISRTAAGKVYVIYGSNSTSNIDLLNLSPSQGFQIYGPTYNSGIGNILDASIDVNNDGYLDIVIDNKYVVFGNSSFNNVDLLNIPSNQGFISTSSVLCSYTNGAGDTNGDGYPDFITNGGIIYGTNSSSNTLLCTSLGFSIQGSYGYIKAVGDINQDGYSDILLGNSYASPLGRTSSGEVWLVYGAASGVVTPSPIAV